MKNIVLLGATGSIGTQVLEIIASAPNQYRLLAFAYGKNTKLALEIIERFHPQMVVCADTNDVSIIKTKYSTVEVSSGQESLQNLVKIKTDNVVVINAIVGSAGLLSTIATIEAGRDVLLANKESLVMAGDIIMKKAKKMGVRIIPIDSEHVALSQILNNKECREVKRLILTASGGSLFHKEMASLKTVTKEEALKHPNWSMGAKITIDSATMMNKGFELMEAHYLFDFPIDKIDAIIHQESIVHSLVEFVDGSIIAQMATPDMRLSINYALNYPHHQLSPLTNFLDLNNLNLTFKTLDEERFPTIKYAKWALSKGSFYPAVLNAGNEALVNLFLKGAITFDQIDIQLGKLLKDPKIINLFHHLPYTVDNIIKIDQLVKNKIYQQEV